MGGEVGEVRYIIAINRRSFWTVLFFAAILAATYCLHKSEVIENAIDQLAERVGE